MHRTMRIILNSTQVECYGHHHVEGLGEIHSKEFLSGMIGLLKVTGKCALQKNYAKLQTFPSQSQPL